MHLLGFQRTYIIKSKILRTVVYTLVYWVYYKAPVLSHSEIGTYVSELCQAKVLMKFIHDLLSAENE